MKKKIPTILIILLIATSGLNFVSAQNELDDVLISENEYETHEIRSLRTQETSEDQLKSHVQRNRNEGHTITNSSENRLGEEVKSLERGYRNVSFDDGYHGYCVNHNLHSTGRGETFIVEDTSNITSLKYGESVGNYLKILFVDHYNYTMNPATTDLSQIIWTFTNYDYKNSNHEIIKSILESASNGRVIPDHGAVAKISDNQEAIFDFELLNSKKDSTQNFFGYRINYRTIDIIDDGLGAIPENSTPESNETIPENNATIKNETIPENSTATNNKTNLKNNFTAENSTVPSKTNETKTLTKIQSEIKENNLIKHATGNEFSIFGILIVIIGLILLIKYMRD
ncbi:MAG: hypothetical protein UIB31_09100 [Methanobrevibacter sp.]|nr:hypothetical protein [Methanobrevibacter sp.]